MANEYARNQKDYDLIDAAVALPGSATITYSDDFDLGLDTVKPEEMELEITIPAIPVTALADGATIKVSIFNAATATPTEILAENIYTLTGATGVDPSIAVNIRYRIPSDALRYLAVGFTLSTGNASAYDASVYLCF